MDNLSLILFSTIIFSVPLIATALGGLFSEKSGVVNIGLEGMMTFGAFAGAAAIAILEASFGVGGIWVLIGVIIGALGGMLFALLHGYLTITLKMDQIISGTAINTIALAAALYMSNAMFNSLETPSKQTAPTLIFGELHIISIVIMLLVVITWYVIYKTKWGLRLRAVGEDPQAADSMGVNVIRMRYQAVLISGLLAGVGGMAIILTTTSRFGGYVIAGKGFVALAVLIFGRWNPWGVLGAGILFGFASTLGSVVPIIMPDMSIPQVYFESMPYIITIIALVLFSKKAVAPKAIGVPYDKEQR